jgi:hypothetical protein
MPLMSINRTRNHRPKHNRTHKPHHESQRNHIAAMLRVLATLARSRLDVALLTVYMWLRLERAGNGLRK